MNYHTVVRALSLEQGLVFSARYGCTQTVQVYIETCLADTARPVLTRGDLPSTSEVGMSLNCLVQPGYPLSSRVTGCILLLPY